MNELIKVESNTINNETVQTVNARDLHEFLENGDKFATWIKDRIEQYGFQEDRDYMVFQGFPKNPQGGRPAKEYAISIDMAKELSMVERNEKGKQARQYFIECEKKLKSPLSAEEFLVYSAQAILEQKRALTRIQQEQEDLKARTDFIETELDDLKNGSEYFTITGYYRHFKKESVSNSLANSLGRKLSKLAKDIGIRLGVAPHPTWGEVKTYPKAFLDQHLDI